jgi:malonate decarboxylase gamma subunit
MPLDLPTLQAEHDLLSARLHLYGDCRDALDIWQRMGVVDPGAVSQLEAGAMQAVKASLTMPSVDQRRESVKSTPAAAPNPALDTLLSALFGAAHQVKVDDDLIHGTAQVNGGTVTVVGSTHHAAIGIELALAQAAGVLQTLRHHPGQPIVLLVDTQGQRLRHRDELLGINRYMAHMGCCIALARQQGHRVIGLVYDQALSGGFITSGLMADACYALPQAEIRVMRLPAMARVTKIDESRLTELSKTNPVFAPGVDNFVAMGGIAALWTGDLQAGLIQALETAPTQDDRAALGAARGGRTRAAEVMQRVLNA